MPKTDWRHLSEVLWARSNGSCERCGCGLVSPDHAERHHRKLRSGGGRHEIINLLLLCPGCHRWVHAHPTMAKHEGAIVASWADPALAPVFHALHGLVRLRPDGSVSGPEWACPPSAPTS